ncbi:MAG: hypothetical protein U1D55_14040 [Phycisphaerae bacterium]
MKLLATMALLLTACRPAPPPAPRSASIDAMRGPYHLQVSVSPAEPWVGDEVRIELSATAPDEAAVAFEPLKFPDDLRAKITSPVDARPAQPGQSQWRQTVAISPVTSGELEIPPATMKYGPRGAELANELLTDPVKLQVRGVLTSQDSMMQPREITGTLLPNPLPMPWWQRLALAGGAVALLALGYGVYRFMRARAARPPPPLSPEEWAMAALSELRVLEWCGSGRVQQLYYRLSEVVRQYIERKFALAAPEMTTEEFLAALARDRGAVPYNADRLREFMTACDVVKYAAYVPDMEAAQAAHGAARTFVEATAKSAHAEAQRRG